MPPALPNRPIDATLSVTKAARLLGVHPNTVRAWSDAGRLRYYRINPRGDRRYRLSDLQRFLAAAAGGGIRDLPPGVARREILRAATAGQSAPTVTDLHAHTEPDLAADRRLDLSVTAELMRLAGTTTDVGRALQQAVTLLRDATGTRRPAAGQRHPRTGAGAGQRIRAGGRPAFPSRTRPRRGPGVRACLGRRTDRC